MKKNLNILMFFLALAVVFTGCKKDDKEPVLDTNATVVPTWVDSPAPDTHFILERDTADVDLTTLSWTKVIYDLPNLPSPLYTIQLLLASTDSTNPWAEPIEMLTLSDLTYTITVSELNTAIVKEIGSEFPEDTVINAGFRIKANVNANDVSNIIDALSEITTFTVTPYPAESAGASLWIPGAYQGWSPADAAQIWETEDAGVFKGFVYFPDVDAFDGHFKFTGNPNWDGPNFGAGATSGTLDTDAGAGDLELPGPGGYYFTVDTNALTWEYEEQSWGLIGSGVLGGDWSEDTNMVALEAPYNVLEVTVDIITPPDGSELRFKYRANDDWALNYGADEGSFVLVNGGTDIPMPDGPGNYTFKMDMSLPIFTYEFTKN
jgi:hypothetical protein